MFKDSNYKILNTMKVESYMTGVDFNTGKVESKLMMETTFSKEMRIVIAKGIEMHEHKAPYPIVIQIVEGEIEFTTPEKTAYLKMGDMLSLEANIFHSLKGQENSVIRLTLSKEDRANRVIEASEIK